MAEAAALYPSTMLRMVPLPILGWGGRLGRLVLTFRLQHQRSVAFVDSHRRAVDDFPTQDRVGERVLEVFLDRPLQRTGAVDGIVADPAEPGAGGLAKIDPDLAVGEKLAEARHLDVDDRPHMIRREPVEQDD